MILVIGEMAAAMAAGVLLLVVACWRACLARIRLKGLLLTSAPLVGTRSDAVAALLRGRR